MKTYLLGALLGILLLAGITLLYGVAATTSYAELNDRLAEELRIIQGASTWPWSPTTLRAFLTAVLLPMFLWATQQVLSRTLLS